MATYCVLGSFTEQGVRGAKDSPKRAEAFKEMAKKCGVTVKEVYWAQGQYDVVTILEASDDLAVTSLALSAVTKVWSASHFLLSMWPPLVSSMNCPSIRHNLPKDHLLSR